MDRGCKNLFWLRGIRSSRGFNQHVTSKGRVVSNQCFLRVSPLVDWLYGHLESLGGSPPYKERVLVTTVTEVGPTPVNNYSEHFVGRVLLTVLWKRVLTSRRGFSPVSVGPFHVLGRTVPGGVIWWVDDRKIRCNVTSFRTTEQCELAYWPRGVCR